MLRVFARRKTQREQISNADTCFPHSRSFLCQLRPIFNNFRLNHNESSADQKWLLFYSNRLNQFDKSCTIWISAARNSARDKFLSSCSIALSSRCDREEVWWKCSTPAGEASFNRGSYFPQMLRDHRGKAHGNNLTSRVKSRGIRKNDEGAPGTPRIIPILQTFFTAFQNV